MEVSGLGGMGMVEARTFGRGGRVVEEDRSLVLVLALTTCRGKLEH